MEGTLNIAQRTKKVDVALIKFLASPSDYFARHSFWINFVNNLGTAAMSRDVREQLSQVSRKNPNSIPKSISAHCCS
uniref:Uncharacterized protein n=1 Tax=Physcomitrium patens TaxID=3218 RepID=A0A2K1JKF9_PHYPA|nr:hypothetical protein PHYPA_016889 [Physcomitrium patens]